MENCKMKTLLYLLIGGLLVMACNTSKSALAFSDKAPVASKIASKSDTVRIANDSLEYELIITDIGFNQYLNSVARPRNFYSQTFLENKNLFFVNEYNRRVLEPFRYNPNIYEMRIDYQSNINYGYEVNYLLYNYFLFFQSAYRQKL